MHPGAGFAATRGLVREILAHPHEHPWMLRRYGQALRLPLAFDTVFLHVWNPTEPLFEMHTHRVPLRSIVLSGTVEQHRYVRDEAGDVYRTLRFPQRRPDATEVRLTELPLERYRAGNVYEQQPSEIHRSLPLPGTVTLVEWGDGAPVDPEMFWHPSAEPDEPWVPRGVRPATRAEVSEFVGRALEVWDGRG